MAGKVKERRGLGRGLEDLFGTAEIKTSEQKGRGGKDTADPENAVQNIDINKIRPNQDQPRQNFDEEKIAELADSILEHGIIEPLIVRKVKNGYEIVAGERRYRAARKAEMKEVPCLVRELTDEQNMLFAIIENLQREDLNAIEEADAFDKMISAYGLTQEQVSKSVGKSRPYIANALRLLKLPQEIRSMVIGGDISSGHARALINITDEKKQLILARRAKEEGLTVRTIEQLAGELTPTAKPGKKAPKKKKDPDVARVEEELKKVVGTKVRINGKGSKGKIEIEYYSRDELDRLIDLLRSLQ